MLWANGNGGLNQHIFKVTSKNGFPRSFYFYQLIDYIGNFKRMAEARKTTMGHITQDHLKQSTIAVPTEMDLPNKLENKLNPIFEKIITNSQEITYLSKQRDELLPLLMNGQVSFKPLVSDERFEYLKERMRELLKQKETEVNCDLSVFRVILKGKLFMKSKIVHSIIEKLGDCFSTHQLDVLQDTINEVLADYDLIVCRSKELRTEKENEELLNSFISAKRIEGCSAKTLKYYENTIRLFLKKTTTELRNIDTNDIRKYLSDFQAKNNSSKVTIDNIRRIFSSFFAWLEDEDYIVKSPVRRIHKIRTETLVKEVISDEDLEILRDNCTEIRDLAIIDFLVSTGVRVGELVKINRADIDFQERQCVVLGKGNKERTVYFNARTKIHLRHYLESRTDNNPALFVTLNSPHTRLSISGVEVRLRALGIKAEVCRIHPHKFRRTLATMAIDKGMPIEQVQKLLGHVKIDTTLHYAMVNQNNVKIAHRRFIG